MAQSLKRAAVLGLPHTPGRWRQTRCAFAGLIEGNWLFAKGHNLKVSYDYFDPDDDVSEDHQVHYNVVWEYTPMQFLQGRGRVGVRIYDGIPQVDSQNRDEFFAELHGFF